MSKKSEDIKWTPIAPKWNPEWGDMRALRVRAYAADPKNYVTYESQMSPADLRSFANWLVGRTVYDRYTEKGYVIDHCDVEMDLHHRAEWVKLP